MVCRLAASFVLLVKIRYLAWIWFLVVAFYRKILALYFVVLSEERYVPLSSTASDLSFTLQDATDFSLCDPSLGCSTQAVRERLRKSGYVSLQLLRDHVPGAWRSIVN